MEFDFQSFLNRKRLKQREAAAILGVSMGFVGMMASGKSKPSYDTIVKLIQAGATLNELFGPELSQKLAENSNLCNEKMPPSNSELKASIREVMKDLLAESQK